MKTISGTGLSEREQETVDAFQRLYYDLSVFDLGPGLDEQAASPVLAWLGVPVSKCPLDLWIYQEIIHQKRPDLIVETGTQYGGSALWLANLLDVIGDGKVVTVDIQAWEALPRHERVRVDHPRIEYLLGSSTSPEVVGRVKALAERAERVMVILDSDHSMAHVLEELSIYSDIVTEGQYLIVEDTSVNGHPVFESFGPGPMEALESFISSDTRFVIDKSREKLLMTFQPNGYLLKAPATGAPDAPTAQWRMSTLVQQSLEERTEQIRLKDAELSRAADYADKLLGEIQAKDAEIERMVGLVRRLEAQLNPSS
ncbi:MAG TPA: CmcI family methyltransferase [Candidatus Anoxymicrobiaceae bacterium]